ncbi:ubiquitin thioesterase otubain-like isoform X2 [Sorghum bicolor]|uniref:ubiquitin thioesterase otubain-like isoform X2 n=1 Tax=Sorghum bicolor TaxID=4558 RepID=UPI000B425301|nr:ubiquitin thioesterase otubain-like isoform X2 [Sorghum bicolor]|eukprot:XP_002441806.2 ubiquitin thioesterase otubain-like isoform X2 [Sorghum bicolor]
MAEKATPEKSETPHKLTYKPSAGSSAGGGGGGGDGDSGAAPRPAPQPEPSSQRPPSPPPPDDDDDDDDDEDYEGFEDDELEVLERRSGWGSLYTSDPQVLCMDSSDPQNPPGYIGRQSCEPLTTQEFFSLRQNWQQLLDGKKTYLRPPKNNRVAKDNYANCLFVTPEPLEKAIQCQVPVPLSDFVRAAAENPTVQQKFKILSEHYVCIRQMRIDGSSFYRAFLFSYLENLGKMQGSQDEVTRLMECVARSKENFCRLHWDSAYFSNPEAFFSSVVSEFENLVNSVANGLNADELYKRSLQEITSSRILCLLRLLTEVHIRTHHADYVPAFEQTQALLFCIASVRPFDAEANTLQMSALSNALGIPTHLALVDGTMDNGIAQVKCFDFFPQSESRKKECNIVRGDEASIFLYSHRYYKYVP